MSGTIRAGGTRTLLRSRPRLVLALGLGLVGRFGYALLPLCLLFTISDVTTFARAATVSAVFGLCTLVMPCQARLVDRHGQRVVLGTTTLVASPALLGMVLAHRAHVTSPTTWCALAVVLGCSVPALGPASRAQWRHATNEDERSLAYSLDAVAEEVVFLLGPLTAALFLAGHVPWRGVLVVAVLLPVGTIGLTTSPCVPPHGAPQQEDSVRASRRPDGVLRRPRMWTLLAAMTTGSLVGSALSTWLAAVADERRRPDAMGLVEAAMGIASIVGGLAWGRLHPPGAWPRQLGVLLVLRLPVLALCLTMPTLWGMSVALVVLSTLTAPGFIVGFLAGDEENPPERQTEASTWLTVFSNLGASLGTAMAGWAHHALPMPLFVGVLAMLVVTACGPLALVGRR